MPMMLMDAPAVLDETIPRRFEAVAARHGTRPAVVADGHVLTYGEVNAAANRIANAIRSCMTVPSPKGPVAVFMRPGAMLPAGILGVLTSGNCYIPLDPGHPAERNAFIVSDAGAAMLLTEHQDLSAAKEIISRSPCDTQIIDVDETAGLSAVNPDAGTSAASPDDVCAIVYTSGSTGHPKGACHSHRNILHATDRYSELAHIGPQDRMSLFHSSASIANATALYGAMLNGAAVMPFSVSGKSPSAIARWLETERVSILHAVPTLFRYICRGLHPERRFRFIRLVRLGGEAITHSEWVLWKDHFQKHAELYVGLGSTEAFNYFQRVYRQDAEITGNVIPVGDPVPGMATVLIGGDGKPAGMGETGEIVVWSEYIFTGYRGENAITPKTVFQSLGPGRHRLFLTGDLARVDQEGQWFHVGRKDHQCKIAGNRVETAEIEQALRRVPPVRDAAVVVHAIDSGEPRIVAFAAIGSEEEPRRSQLRNSLSALLPGYMIPSAFFFMSELPLLPGGKIDRPGLLERIRARSVAYCSGRNPMERTLADICRQTLGVERVGIFDDLFFDLGCDSLTAVEILHEIDRIFRRRLPLSILYEAPTVAQICLKLQDVGWKAPESGILAMHSEGKNSPLFAVSGVFGHVLRLLLLGKRLGEEQPLYGLQPPDMDWMTNGCRTIPEMAEFYVRQILRIQPAGPYQLFGFSFGGIIAFEIGCQLQQAGHEVSLLSMLDTSPPDFMGPGGIDRMDRGNWMEVKESEDWIEQKGIDVANAHRKALDAYLLKDVFYGSITYFWCREAAVHDGRDRRLEWRKFATEGLRVIEIPGIHGQFHREPQLTAVVNGIRECLAETRQA